MRNKQSYITFSLILLIWASVPSLRAQERSVQKSIQNEKLSKDQRFIITMWCPPPANQEQLSILKRDHYTLTGIGQLQEDYGEDHNQPAWEPQEYRKRLDLANGQGIQAIILSRLLKPQTLHNPKDLALLNKVIDETKKHPATFSYHLIDEPSVPVMKDWLPLYHFLKKKDPEHAGYINLLPVDAPQEMLGVSTPIPIDDPEWNVSHLHGSTEYADMIGLYNAHIKAYVDMYEPTMLSYDHYHFLKNGDGIFYFLNLELIRAAALKRNIPFMNIIQASTILPEWRLVNESEMRWLAYTTLVYGAKGLNWFLYWGPTHPHGGMYQDGKKTAMADFGAHINKEITHLGAELVKLTSTNVYHTAPLPVGGVRIPDNSPVKTQRGEALLGFFESEDTPHAFMVMNRNYRHKTDLSFSLDYGDGVLWKFSKISGIWEKIQHVTNGTTISISLDPSTGELYKVVKN